MSATLEELDEMSRKAKAAWLIAGFRALKRHIIRARLRLSQRKTVADDVRSRGIEAYDAVIAEINTQMRDLEFGWEPGPVVREVKP